MRLRSRTGFSLVELLVVIAIIVVLLGILLPALNRAREMSRRAVCLSNIHQLTAAWMMYAGQNKGWMCNSVGNPEWLLFDPKTPTNILYTPAASDPLPLIPNGQLWPFLKNRRAYICPGDTQSQRNVSGSGGPPGVFVAGASGTSYSVNVLLSPPPAFGDPNKATTLAQVRHPAARIVFCEDDMGWLFDGSIAWMRFGMFHGGSAGRVDGMSISFADGHAIFWNYAVPQWMTLGNGWALVDNLDGAQISAWFSGVTPPGVMQ